MLSVWSLSRLWNFFTLSMLVAQLTLKALLQSFAVFIEFAWICFPFKFWCILALSGEILYFISSPNILVSLLLPFHILIVKFRNVFLNLPIKLHQNCFHLLGTNTFLKLLSFSCFSLWNISLWFPHRTTLYLEKHYRISDFSLSQIYSFSRLHQIRHKLGLRIRIILYSFLIHSG